MSVIRKLAALGLAVSTLGGVAQAEVEAGVVAGEVAAG